MHLRAIYDKHGEFGLKEGIIGADGKRVGGGYFMSRSADKIYDEVYTSSDPWADVPVFDGKDFVGSMFGDGHGGQGRAAPPAPKDVTVVCDCTLAEFYNGAMKTVTYSYSKVQHDARTVKQAQKSHTFQVFPGYSENTELSFANLGNEVPGGQATNLVVKFA